VVFAAADDGRVQVVLSNDSATVAPGWDTVTTAVCTGVPVVVVNVTVAGRETTVVFAAAARVTVPLFVPVAGETVNQVWSDVTFHAAFEVTFTVVFAATDDNRVQALISNDNVTVAAGCDTATLAV